MEIDNFLRFPLLLKNLMEISSPIPEKKKKVDKHNNFIKFSDIENCKFIHYNQISFIILRFPEYQNFTCMFNSIDSLFQLRHNI